MAGKRKLDEPTGLEDTGHEWDGIRELDRPLPRWWLWVFYASILAAAVYWVLMPAWPGLTGHTTGVLGQSDRADVAGDMQALAVQRGVEGQKLRNASLEQIESDPELQAYALAAGQSLFGDNCATCHGQGGAGGKGYPNLRDDVWLYDRRVYRMAARPVMSGSVETCSPLLTGRRQAGTIDVRRFRSRHTCPQYMMSQGEPACRLALSPPC